MSANQPVITSLDALAVGRAPSTAFVINYETRSPTIYDNQYPIQKLWLNTETEQLYLLENFYTSSSILYANWILIGSSSLTETLTGNTGGAVPPTANNINVVGDGVYLTTVGTPGTSTLTIEPGGGLTTLYTENTGTATPMAGNLNVLGGTGISTTGSGNTITINAGPSVATTYVENTGSATPSANVLNVVGGTGITTSGSGNTVTITSTGSDTVLNYTNVTHAMSPYTVLTTDFYISVDCSGGTVTLDFPNSPTFKQYWIVKDRTGNSSTNNIIITTSGGIVTFDGQTSLIMDSNYMALNVLANATPTYEVW